MNTCLAVDIGNSGLRVAAMDPLRNSIGEPTRINWRHSDGTAQDAHAPNATGWFTELENFIAAQSHASFDWLVSSVRSDALGLLDGFVRARPQDSWRAVGFKDVPMFVAVDFPDRLGIDRLLAAWAASKSTEHRPYIVIQAGSAVTVDLVSANSNGSDPARDRFEGGAILPGVPMIMRLLGKAADMLPEVVANDLTDLPPLPGKNTEAAMTCGASSALVGGVRHLVSRYRETCGQHTPVILSGGDGMRLSPYIEEPLIVQPHLVLSGLLMLAQRR
jgi:type III pantothenate kinase